MTKGGRDETALINIDSSDLARPLSMLEAMPASTPFLLATGHFRFCGSESTADYDTLTSISLFSTGRRIAMTSFFSLLSRRRTTRTSIGNVALTVDTCCTVVSRRERERERERARMKVLQVGGTATVHRPAGQIDRRSQ